MKTATITFHRSVNYGSVLQAYALQRFLISKGIDNEIIDFIHRDNARQYDLFRVYKYRKSLNAFLMDVKKMKKLYKKKSKFNKFIKNNCHLTAKRYYDNLTLKELSVCFDAYICGGDQIWNIPCNFGVVPAFFLDFVDNDRLRISYAPSLGRNTIDDKYIEEFTNKAQKLDYISVREVSNVSYLENLLSKPVINVLDPTLILSKENWESIEGSIRFDFEYIAVYMLEENKELINYVNKLSSEKKLRIIHFNFINPGFINAKNMSDSGPENYLRIINQAKYVVTNSFHATVFSVIFEKMFCTFTHSKSYSRMVDFLKLINAEKRIYHNKFDIDQAIDYKHVATALKEERKKSIKFLLDSLQEKEKCLDGGITYA